MDLIRRRRGWTVSTGGGARFVDGLVVCLFVDGLVCDAFCIFS